MGIVRGRVGWTIWTALLAATVGCGGSDRAAVSGQVTLGGKPVEDGAISFIPAGGAGAPAWGKIEAGRYSIPARQGPAIGVNRVEIRWTRKTGKKMSLPGGMIIDEQEEAVPARYNVQSELQAEIKRGKNTHDFPLESQ